MFTIILLNIIVILGSFYGNVLYKLIRFHTGFFKAAKLYTIRKIF